MYQALGDMWASHRFSYVDHQRKEQQETPMSLAGRICATYKRVVQVSAASLEALEPWEDEFAGQITAAVNTWVMPSVERAQSLGGYQRNKR